MSTSSEPAGPPDFRAIAIGLSCFVVILGVPLAVAGGCIGASMAPKRS